MEKIREVNESYIKDIELKAKKKFNVIKMGDDNYLLPEQSWNTYSLNGQLKNKFSCDGSDSLKYKDLLKSVADLQVEDKDVITVRCKEIVDNGLNLIEIMNLSKCFDKVINVEISGEYDHEQREDILQLLVDRFKEKKSVQVTVYANYNFSDLAKLVNKEEGN